MKCDYACNSAEHNIARRNFLGQCAAGAGAVGLGLLTRPAVAEQLAREQKKILVINMAGGLSQLESWDPKPGTDTGGPFRAIPSSIPGVHVSELLPHTAQQLHHLGLVRSVNTKENDHGKGAYFMTTGRRRTPAADYPKLGAVTAKALAKAGESLPGHIHVAAGGGGGRSNDAAYLGPKFASITVGGGKPPQYSTPPKGLTDASELRRQQMRQKMNQRFALKRRTAETDAYVQNYEQARNLVRQRDVFDTSKESAQDHERYGKHDFGQQCLLARRLLEHGVPYVQVTHSNYDTHNENFIFHLEQVAEFDRPFATLVADIVDRGMLDSTLIVVLSEFGRTPKINNRYGRDHWGTAWSVLVGGAGIQRGAVIGKTNANGTQVTDREVDGGHLFHTYLQAVGVDPTSTFDIGGRDLPLADPSTESIQEILA